MDFQEIFKELYRHGKYGAEFFCKTIFIIFLIPFVLIVPLSYVLYSVQQSYWNIFYMILGMATLFFIFKSWKIWKTLSS